MKTSLSTVLLFWVSCSLLFSAGEGLLDLEKVPRAGVTQVWSPLFKASWDRLVGLQEGHLEEVKPPNAIIEQLEGFRWKEEEVMPAGGYAVYAGRATRQFGLKTAAAVRKEFGIEIDSERIPVVPGGNATYGVLLRNLSFPEKFFQSRRKGLDFSSADGKRHQVQFFGTAGSVSARYRNSVQVLAYDANDRSFALSMITNEEDERLIVYRPAARGSFRTAIEKVREMKKEPLAGNFGSLRDGALHEKDVVKIPYVTVDAMTSFTRELKGSLHYEGDPVPRRIVKAVQFTQFELFESGAKVRMEVSQGDESFGVLPPQPRIVPRSFVCEEPFFVFLWREGAEWPYLGAWIDGGDCLRPFVKN